MSTPDVLLYLREWYAALSIATSGASVAGLFGVLGGKADEDEVVAEANEFCLDTLSDADVVGGIEADVGANLRDQISIEQAQEMAAEAEGRRWGWRWN